NSIFMVPFGSSLYSVIKDTNSNNVYLGVSPVKIFSGVNDISGHYSFNFSDEANTIDGDIINRNYKKLQHILFEHNINYVMITKNIPSEVKGSYAYNLDLIAKQDSQFL